MNTVCGFKFPEIGRSEIMGGSIEETRLCGAGLMMFSLWNYSGGEQSFVYYWKRAGSSGVIM